MTGQTDLNPGCCLAPPTGAVGWVARAPKTGGGGSSPAAAFFLVLALAGPAVAQPACLPGPMMAPLLAGSGMVAVQSGVTPSQVVTLFRGPDGRWVIVAQGPDGLICVVGAGAGWRDLGEPA